MKAVIRGVLAAALFGVLISGCTSADERSTTAAETGRTAAALMNSSSDAHAESGCDSAPDGLHGLCNAYCVAMDCDNPRGHASDRACEQVLESYHKRSGGKDPLCAGGGGASCGWTLQHGTAQDDRYQAAVTTNAGITYAVGFTSGSMGSAGSAGGIDAVLSKIDGNGALIWMRQFGSSADDLAVDVVLDASGAIYVAGHSNADLDGDGSPIAPTCGVTGYVGNCNDVFVAKYDADGNQMWLEQWGTERREAAQNLALDPMTGDLLMLVSSSNTAYGSSQSPQIVRWNAQTGQPTPIWMYSAWDNNNPVKLAVAADGSIYVAGRSQFGIPGALTSEGAAGGGWYLFKVSPAGQTTWVTQAGSAGHDFPYDIVLDGAGDIYISGYVQGVVAGAPVGTTYQGADGSGWGAHGDVAVVKFAPNGSRLWAAQMGTSRNDVAYAINTSTAGGVLISSGSTGDLETGASMNIGGYDIFVTQLGANGTWGTTRHIGTAQDDHGVNIQSISGATMIAGWTAGDLEGDGASGGTDAVLINLCD